MLTLDEDSGNGGSLSKGFDEPGFLSDVSLHWHHAEMAGDLHYGDNLDILRGKIAPESVDLIYLDPPFNSDRTYNLIHKESKAQHDAFFDTWHWDDKAERAFAELTERAPIGVQVPDALRDMMKSLKAFLGKERRDTTAYLSMMAIRLIAMRRLLRPTGSLYLHCDPTASHYLKMILDSVFGVENFRSEIIWKRTTAHNSAKRYGPVHDVIFFYSKTSEFTWNQQYGEYDEVYINSFFTHYDDKGRRWRRTDLTGPGTRKGDSGKPWKGFDPTIRNRHWQPASYFYEKYKTLTGSDLAQFDLITRLDKLEEAGLIHWPAKEGGMPQGRRFLEDAPGVPLQDVWTDIKPIHNIADERTGYATQKPAPLLKRIIQASSNPGDMILDPFCGCGTTVEAAEELGRKWIGVDIAIRAIDVIKDRLDEKFKRRVWKEHGEPSDTDAAEHLADTNPYDFQWWAVRKLGGQPPKGEKKKGGDGGIDGELLLREFDSGSNRRGLISVKGGRTLTPDMVKSLKTTMDLEKADFGILITMHPPTSGMRNVARECGTLSWVSADSGKLAHKIRIITVPEMFAGTVQLPGINLTPRTQSSPPPPEPRKGENLQLPFPTTRPKAQKRGLSKTHAPVMAVADSARQKRRRAK